jgi:hypothetical protein
MDPRYLVQYAVRISFAQDVIFKLVTCYVTSKFRGRNFF